MHTLSPVAPLHCSKLVCSSVFFITLNKTSISIRKQIFISKELSIKNENTIFPCMSYRQYELKSYILQGWFTELYLFGGIQHKTILQSFVKLTVTKIHSFTESKVQSSEKKIMWRYSIKILKWQLFVSYLEVNNINEECIVYVCMHAYVCIYVYGHEYVYVHTREQKRQ